MPNDIACFAHFSFGLLAVGLLSACGSPGPGPRLQQGQSDLPGLTRDGEAEALPVPSSSTDAGATDATRRDGSEVDASDATKSLPFVCGARDWTEQAVDVGEVNLNVACQGDPLQPLVAMLHGYPESHLAYNALAGGLVSEGYVVVAPDQRGYNLSDKPAEVDSYRAAHLLTDLEGLLDATGRSRLLLVGHDWGAVVAYLYAHAHPERVRGLVVLNGPHPDIWGDADLDPVQAQASAGYLPLVAGPLAPLALPYIENQLSAHLDAEELSAYRAAWNVPEAFPSMGRWFQANVYPEYTLPTGITVDVPTLALWGMDDPFVTPSQLDHLPAFISDLEVVRLEGVDHWITHQRTDSIIEHMRRFIARLPD